MPENRVQEVYDFLGGRVDDLNLLRTYLLDNSPGEENNTGIFSVLCEVLTSY